MHATHGRWNNPHSACNSPHRCYNIPYSTSETHTSPVTVPIVAAKSHIEATTSNIAPATTHVHHFEPNMTTHKKCRIYSLFERVFTPSGLNMLLKHAPSRVWLLRLKFGHFTNEVRIPRTSCLILETGQRHLGNRVNYFGNREQFISIFFHFFAST